jgi:septal ring factor EnvC (AmiA/AmiB activator)
MMTPFTQIKSQQFRIYELEQERDALRQKLRTCMEEKGGVTANYLKCQNDFNVLKQQVAAMRKDKPWKQESFTTG